jgi:SAM-dependent methyltransferase
MPCPACGAVVEFMDNVPCYAPALAHDAPGFHPEHFARLAQSEEGHFWFQARNELIVHALRRFFPHARHMLEIGCGTGYVLRGITERLPTLQLSGSEVFLEGLGFAAKRVPTADLFQMDAREIPYANEFDVIGAFDVIEHIEEDERVLREMHRALKSHGGIVLTVPQHPWLWSAQDERACHVRRYRYRELKQKLQEAGFTVVFSSSFVSLLLPLLAASRLRKHARVNGEGVNGELKPNPLVNSALYHVLRFESLLIRGGMRFPIGGTRLVIAAKST